MMAPHSSSPSDNSRGSFTHLQQNWGKSAYGATPLTSCSGAPSGDKCYSLGTVLTWTAVLNVCTSSTTICNGTAQATLTLTNATALLQPGETYVSGTELATAGASKTPLSPVFYTGLCSDTTSVPAPPPDCSSVPSTYTYLWWNFSSAPPVLNGFPQANFTYQTTLTAAGTLNDTDVAHYTVNGFVENPPAFAQVYAAPATPSVTTSVSPSTITLSALPTPSVTDTATISGGYNPTGTITFYAYYSATSAPACSDLVFTSSPVTVVGNGMYTSGPFTPTQVGYYFWTASYSGDANNTANTTACGASGETVTVSPATPSITTFVSPSTIVLSSSPTPSAEDTATISGGYQPTGTITFHVYYSASAVADCTDLVFTSAPVTVVGNGDYTSGPFTPTQVGYYFWTADYSGDANNTAVVTPCGEDGETLTVTPASPSITTSVSPSSIILGGSPSSATDTATLSGGYDPTGTITFSVYYSASSTAVCTDLVFTSSPVTVVGNGMYTSESFTPTVAGYYFWTAAYSGDSNNSAYTTPCGATGETLSVSVTMPTLNTQVNPASIMLNQSAEDNATLAGASDPTGTITFYVYYSATSTPDCTDLVFTSAPVTVVGNGVYNSGPFTPTEVGTYFWTAVYSGDANNSPITTVCGAPGETLTVTHCTEDEAAANTLLQVRQQDRI
jgi:uncharacterized protein (DUF2141 family)